MSRMSEIAAELAQLGELDDLRAENARRREALERIVNEYGTPPEYVVDDMREIARAALTPRAEAAPAGWDTGENVR